MEKCAAYNPIFSYLKIGLQEGYKTAWGTYD